MTALRGLAIALVVACGHPPAPHGDPTEPKPVRVDHRTEIERRRDAACERLAPKLTECAIEDAKRTLTPAQYKKLDPEALRSRHREKFIEECEGSPMSSRQVRVLEVCFREETECDPLADCLRNLQPTPSGK